MEVTFDRVNRGPIYAYFMRDTDRTKMLHDRRRRGSKHSSYTCFRDQALVKSVQLFYYEIITAWKKTMRSRLVIYDVMQKGGLLHFQAKIADHLGIGIKKGKISQHFLLFLPLPLPYFLTNFVFSCLHSFFPPGNVSIPASQTAQ